MGKIMELKHTLTVALAVLLFSHSAAQGELSAHLPLPEELKKDALPHFSVRDRNGQNLLQRRHLERMIPPQTKRVALVFFATWCMPCAKGATMLKNARDDLAKNGVEAIFVNVGESDIDAIHKWIGQYGDPAAPLVMDNRTQMAGAFGLLEKNGTIIMPKILVLDAKLKPLFLLGTEGSDFPQTLWEYNP
jgi:thiol-disulfide isomerase/thioredoxin